MKPQFKTNNFIILILAVLIMGCQDTSNLVSDENLNASFVKAYPVDGFTEGEINQTIEVTIEFNHPVPNLDIKKVEKNVIDGFTAEYVLIAEKSDRTEIFETITVNYHIAEAGAHSLKFYYKLDDSEKEFLGSYNFSINN